MYKTVCTIGIILTLLIALPSISSAGDHPKKYGIEVQLGGGYFLMDDVNEYIPSEFTGITMADPDKINIGEQVGFGLTYRHIDNFGWQFGFNKMAFVGIQKYRAEVQLPNTPVDSWAEQTVSGAEFYALATWYSSLGSGDLFFGLGPAVYWAILDRSIDIVNDAGGTSHLTKGSFSGANGKSMGVMATFGFELPIGDMTGLVFQLGGRYARIMELEYEDPSTHQDEVVYKNPGTGTHMTVDFTGGFFKMSLRTYFKPSSDWRSPKR